MAKIQPNTEAKQQPKFFARAHNLVKNGKPSTDFAAVLMDENDAIVETIPFAFFSSASKAETAGLLHWPQAHIDVDEMVRIHDEKYTANRAKVIAKYRADCEAMQAARSMAAREGISIDEATAKLKEAAKAAKLVEVVADAEVFAD